MKTIILNKEVNEEIDWSKPQWVISKDEKIIIITNGKHDSSDFEGTNLPCDDYPNGEFSHTWSKEFFKLISTDGLTIHIQND